MTTKKKFNWYNLALMGFTTVWSFGNIINGFANFNGVGVSLFWFVVLLLYFVPYSLMVGELGATFSKESGGVSLWIDKTSGKKLAYFAGWTYFVVHLPYISQKPSSIMIAASWAIFGKSYVSEMSITFVQLAGLAIFLVALFLASKGLSFLKKIASVAGFAIFVMSLLYIVMMILAPAIPGTNTVTVSLADCKPNLSLETFLNISVLIFAVGGCEKISPYVNKLDKPEKDFPRGMIVLAIMVVICAMLGTFAMGMMFDSNNIPEDLMANGAYYAFQKLDDYYHLGNLLLIIYSISVLASQVAVIILSIDAPLNMLLGNADKENIPEWFYKQNKHGAYVNGMKIVGIIVSILILLPILGINDLNQLVKWLVKLNSICMPLRYLWVFFAYIMLKRKEGQFGKADYIFVKSKALGITLGLWCFIITAVSCIIGMYSENKFELIMNVVTPVILVLSGFLLPWITKKKSKKA